MGDTDQHMKLICQFVQSGWRKRCRPQRDSSLESGLTLLVRQRDCKAGGS